MSRKSEIQIKVDLDENSHPEKIVWKSTDIDTNEKECKSFLLSLWDGNDQNTLKIDLWTKEMRIDEMDRFFYQSFITLAETYANATGNQKGSQDIKEFANAFAIKAGILSS